MSRTPTRLTARLPLLVFLGMYIFSCYLGVVCLLISKDFWAWTNYFSRPQLPSLHLRGLWVLLILLNAGPVLLWLGYEAGLGGCRRYLKWQGAGAAERPSIPLVFVPFAMSVAFGLWSLIRTGAFAHVSAWTDYNAYVHARWELFSRISFFEYVNVYTWLPCFSVCVLFTRRRWWFIPVLGILTLIQLMLFLKKALLTSIVIIACAIWSYWCSGREPRAKANQRVWLRTGVALCLVLYSMHAALTVRLVLSNKSHVMALSEQEKLIAQQTERRKPVLEVPGRTGIERRVPDQSPRSQNEPSRTTPLKMGIEQPASELSQRSPSEPVRSPRVKTEIEQPGLDLSRPAATGPAPEVPGESAAAAGSEPTPIQEDPRIRFEKDLIPPVKGRAVVLYTFFAPLTRTSVPTIAYAELFPRSIPYYHLDLGLDILRIGTMPDDNRSVSDYLWPDQKGGSVAVPFHFVLYSQGGLPIALIGSFLVGVVLACCWYPVSVSRQLWVAGSLYAGVVLTYAWLNSIDSLRNNTVVSYGMIWALVPIIVTYCLERLASRRHNSEPPEASAAELENR